MAYAGTKFLTSVSIHCVAGVDVVVHFLPMVEFFTFSNQFKILKLVSNKLFSIYLIQSLTRASYLAELV